MGTSISPISLALYPSPSVANTSAAASTAATTASTASSSTTAASTTQASSTAQSQALLLAELQAQSNTSLSQLFTSQDGDTATLSSQGLSLANDANSQSSTDSFFQLSSDLGLLNAAGTNVDSASFTQYVLPTLTNTIPGLAQALATAQAAQQSSSSNAAASAATPATTTPQPDPAALSAVTSTSSA